MAFGNGQASSLKGGGLRLESQIGSAERRQVPLEQRTISVLPSPHRAEVGLLGSEQFSIGDRSAGSVHPVEQRVAQRSGIVDAFIKTCQRWGLNEDQQVILLGYFGNEFFARRILEGGWLRVPQDVRDRIGYVLGISVGLGALYNENAQAEVTWLGRNHPKLDGVSPLALMLQGRMVALMTVAHLVAEERELI